ncbi:hypothetical protein Barb6_01033 [Bacteroidales bacterium Barb6]|nr:hypothetical protein Barb6_01033 [Bacteroidales bacterium Barb6]
MADPAHPAQTPAPPTTATAGLPIKKQLFVAYTFNTFFLFFFHCGCRVPAVSISDYPVTLPFIFLICYRPFLADADHHSSSGTMVCRGPERAEDFSPACSVLDHISTVLFSIHQSLPTPPEIPYLLTATICLPFRKSGKDPP